LNEGQRVSAARTQNFRRKGDVKPMMFSEDLTKECGIAAFALAFASEKYATPLRDYRPTPHPS
jgi:hypothetical protein